VQRWLLNNFTTWELALIIIGGIILIALLGLWAIRRWLPGLRDREHNDITGVILGVLAVVYGIVLAFVIVALYEESRAASADVRLEATALSEIYRDSRAFSPAAARRVKAAVGDYDYAVVVKEWPAMRDGRESQQSWNALNHIYATVQSYTPKTEVQRDYYGAVTARVDNLAGARRERLNDAEGSLPTIFVILLIVGALILLFTTFLFGSENPLLHTILSLLVAILVGLSLLVALVLDYPFSGEVSVSNSAFTRGALSDFQYRITGAQHS